MTNDRSVLEHQIERVELRPFTLETFHRRRQRKNRNRRIGTAVVALTLAAAGMGGLLRSFSSGPVPATDPFLGVFEPVAGRIVYVNQGNDRGYDAGVWAVDPSGPSDTTPGPSVADDVVSTLVPLELDGEPLGWSSDGTELLVMRSVGDELLPEQYLYILHADGSETRLNREPMGISGATISPDGTRVVFAGQYDLSGLYVVDAEGGRPVPLPIPQAAEGASDPTFSPDGTQIAYLAGNDEAEVWVANADGTNAHQILADEPTVFRGVSGPVWSPAGDRLAIGVGTHQRSGGSIYTFAPDGSDFTEVIDGGSSPHWSPDGSQIAYTIQCDEDPTFTCVQFDPQAGLSPAGLAIADADGSNVRAFGFAASGPWHPVPATDEAPSPFVGTWTSTELDDPGRSQTMTIRPAEDGALDIVLHDESSWLCSNRQTRVDGVDTPSTLTGTGRLEDATTLVVPSPVLACVGVDGREKPDSGFSEEQGGTSYTLVLDLPTDRLFDNLGVAWHRGATPENGADTTTECGGRFAGNPGTCAMLGGEVTFHAYPPWDDHSESYIDPLWFFLLGPDDAAIDIAANPLREASCGDAPLSVPASAEALVRAIQSNPDLDATVPVVERVGGIDALRLDVAAVPGAPTCFDGQVPVVSVSGRPWGDIDHGELGRLYVLDLPGGSARALAIMITAPEAAFEQAVQAAAPVVDSFEFNAG